MFHSWCTMCDNIHESMYILLNVLTILTIVRDKNKNKMSTSLSTPDLFNTRVTVCRSFDVSTSNLGWVEPGLRHVSSGVCRSWVGRELVFHVQVEFFRKWWSLATFLVFSKVSPTYVTGSLQVLLQVPEESCLKILSVVVTSVV